MAAWGHPKTDSDISTLFSSYLSGTLAQIPWSDEPLRPETNSISEPLIKLNDEKNWWTVGSQPAVDGCESSDEIFGFGPAGGYVYQKSFVELFLTQPELELFIKRVELEDERLAKEGKVGLIKYFAGNKAGLSKTNLAEGEVNVVTWGVFAGRELVTTTLIEEMSFTAWKEEAFAIWGEWSHLYPIGSDSRKLIEGIAETRWLLSVVHHGYKDEGGLWNFLLAQ